MRRIGSMLAGAGMALLPMVAAAQNATGDRAVEAPGTLDEALLYTLLGLAFVFVIAALGYLYREKRGMYWAFQEPDAPHDDEHH